ncbi:MAG: long-chain fatty acid--CoA ligase [Bacteroidetes bacterium]|nr:long-chain fatty acid--CoA ligase [Bacteroidota bacterium]
MEKHLVEMMHNSAARYGMREVFRYKESGAREYKSYNWQELSDITNRVAKSLLALGFGPGSNIGIFSDNKPQWTFSDLGILAVRGVSVPFFATASKPQLKYIVDETLMELIFVGNREQMDKALWLFGHTPSLKTVVCFNNDLTADEEGRCLNWSAFLKLGDNGAYGVQLERILKEAEPDDLATIIYTSGTTGEPKGVMLDHDNFFSCFKNHDERLIVNEQDVSFCFLPLSHIFERGWTYYMLYKGAVNVYLENPKTVIEELPKVRPSVMCTVPRFFEKTYEGIRSEEARWAPGKRKIFEWAVLTGHEYSAYIKNNKKPPLGVRLRRGIADKLVLKKLRSIFGGNIRFIPCAGAAIRPELLKFFHAAGLFVNYGYGSTEATATVSCFRDDIYEFESCGTVMPGTTVKISDEGEILISGPTVFKGYYKKPKETAKVLKEGWYYSGDQGTFSEAGNLIMLDRINDIFKTSGGKFVSPQKVELLLGDDQFIEQVVVLGDNRKFISALIVPSFAVVRSHFPEISRKHKEDATLISDDSVLEFFKKRLELIQEDLVPYERVVKFTLLPEQFSIENEALTSTLKLKRKVISALYKEQIEAMYL